MNFKERLAGKREMARPKSFDDWQDWRDVTGLMDFPNGVPPRGLMKVVANNLFTVQMYGKDSRWGQLVQLVVRRIDGNEIRDNEVLIRIKDELCDATLEAVEHLPAKASGLPISNQLRIIWVMPPGFALPFNYGVV